MDGEANRKAAEEVRGMEEPPYRKRSSLSPSEEIIQHIQNVYGICPSSVDVNIQTNGGKDLFKVSKSWSAFFKCEKDLYDVINKYIKTNKMDYHLHAYLKGITSEAEQEGGSVKGRPTQMEEKFLNILIYIISLFYKQIQDLNIVSLLSERMLHLLNEGICRSDDNGDGKCTNDDSFLLDKATILTTLEVYNYVNAMNDELFDRLFSLLNKCYLTSASPGRPLIISDEEIVLILRSLYIQKFKDHTIVDTIVRSLRDAPHLSAHLSVNSFLYLTLLSRMDNDSLCKVNSALFYVCPMGQLGGEDSSTTIEERTINPKEKEQSTICEKPTLENQIEQIKFKVPLSATDCIKLLYGYFLLGENHINWFVIHKLLLRLHGELKDEEKIHLLEKENKKVLQMVTIVRTYLRYKKRSLYDNLPKGLKRVLKNLQNLHADEEHQRRKDRKFVQKVSWHLIKLRIAHVKNGYKGGIPLDILEKTKKLVWMCFSYHQYYVRTIDLTAETLLQMDLLKAMNYKIAKVHYYQFSRMKARRTRFEYIRMCRYYTLRDRRNYDDEFEGWNLPYINWYHRKNKNVHVSNYFYGYTPVSHMEY